MSKQPKDEPSLSPDFSSIAESPKASILRAITEPQTGEDIIVKLKVSGGIPSKAYRFDFQASGKGEFHCEMKCELSKRETKASKRTIESKQFANLLKNLAASGVLETEQEPPRFLPDTVIGTLEISDGKSAHRIYFAADPEQAITQGKVPSPEVLKAVDSIYALASKLTGQRMVKP